MQPPPTHKANSRSDRFSGLWEFYLDREPADEEAGSEDDSLKNIRGYLLKRRKSPLKGWHKVTLVTPDMLAFTSSFIVRYSEV